MIIISGPSTVGKNPFIYRVCRLYDFKYILPCTTRQMRSGEIEGKDYIFLNKQEFQSKIFNKEISEWDYCLENYYGYIYDFPGDRSTITHGLSRMALRIKAKYPNEIKTIFLMPQNIEKIYSNLEQMYSGKTLCLRRTLVEEELCHSVLFDKVFLCPESIFDLLTQKSVIHFLLNEKTLSCI